MVKAKKLNDLKMEAAVACDVCFKKHEQLACSLEDELSWHKKTTLNAGKSKAHAVKSLNDNAIRWEEETTLKVEKACTLAKQNDKATAHKMFEPKEDSLLIAIVLKGLPESVKPLVVVVTQSDKQQTFVEFKAALRSFEDTERTRIATSDDDSVMKTVHGSPRGAPKAARGGNSDIICYKCKQAGHIARFCESKPKLWCS